MLSRVRSSVKAISRLTRLIEYSRTMQRRRFVQAVTTATSAAAVTAQQAPPASEPVKIATVSAETVAETVPHFFTPRQFATLNHLSLLIQPATNGRPGAVETGAAAFLDFLIGVSPAPRQQLYRGGLDYVDAEAHRLFTREFSALTAEQADKILRPLLVPWTFDPPTNPRQRFLADLRADLRTATLNSKEMALAPSTTARRRRGPGGAAPYWRPIDPTR